ncbi:PREDICTED: forkhead box protein N2-like [Acropora digitifera]|uniref:Forkhead box N1/4 protein n=1 Tax=Acropora digitifera TaxID=70779 RepID=A0A0A8K8T5_ACRDI|nr:PREDICTED: forkhead box protein N2-like [Acropora digitifera]BAQ19126.1 forkhead box N1/4 protein [Acropora digitifera]
MMNSSSQALAFYDTPDSLSLQEMVDCDSVEMDFNLNDPLFQLHENGLFQDNHHYLMSMRQERPRTDCPPAGDLTNLQWLQSVSIPMEKNASSEKQVMVDPNTALPVQWPNPQQVSMSHSQVNVTSAVATSQMLQARAVESKPKSSHHGQKNGTKDGLKSQEKAYPKPLFSYSCLIAMALKNSDSGTLPVSEIYKFMMGKFPYFKTAPDGWKNSVRHNLSLNKAFCKLERPQGASQRKGCLWSLKPERREQMDKEIKKWKKKHTEAIRASMANPDELSVSSDDLEYSPEEINQTGNCEDRAAEDAAKELFGNDLIQEIQQNDVLDWDDIISQSTDLSLDPPLSTCSTLPMSTQPLNGMNGCDPITTVEMENSSHFFVNSDGQDFDIPGPYISHYYSMQPQQHINVSF